MKKIIIKLILPSILLFIACNNPNKTNVKIGLIADLTGSMALYGNWVKNGVEIAKDSCDNIDLIIEDSKSEPKNAVNAIQKLITEDVNFIITGNGSSAVMSIAPIANNNHNIVFVCLASSPNISEAGSYVFRNRVSGLYEVKSLVDFSKKEHFTNFGAIALNNEAGMPYINAFKTQLELIEERLLSNQLVDANQTNLSSQALKFKNNDIKTVLLALQAAQAVNFINQCIEINYFPTWLGISSLKSDKILEFPDTIKNNFYIASEDIDISNPNFQNFNKIYIEIFNENAGIYAVNGYDAFNVLNRLIKECNSDVEKIKKALHEKQFIGAGGNMTFDKNGDAKRNVQIFRILNESFIKCN